MGVGCLLWRWESWESWVETETMELLEGIDDGAISWKRKCGGGKSHWGGILPEGKG